MQQFNKSTLHFHDHIKLLNLNMYYAINDNTIICNYRHSFNYVGYDHLTYDVIAVTTYDTDLLYITIYISKVLIFNEYCMFVLMFLQCMLRCDETRMWNKFYISLNKLTEWKIWGIISVNILLHNLWCSQFDLIENNYYYCSKYFKSVLNRKQLFDDIMDQLYNVAVIILLFIYRYRMLISATYVGGCVCTCINPSVYICVCILIDMCATSTCMFTLSHTTPRDRRVTCELWKITSYACISVRLLLFSILYGLITDNMKLIKLYQRYLGKSNSN